MRILMTLSNPFTHDPRVLNEAKSLVEQGHEITVLAWDKEKENEKIEEKDGIRTVRFQNTKFMDLLMYDIFRLRYWWKNGYKLALKLHKKEEFDVIHAHDFSTLPLAVKLKKKIDIPLIYDAHEIWGYMVARDIPQWWANHFLKKEKQLIDFVDHIITVNKPLENYFKKISKSPITIIRNCKPLQETTYSPPKNETFTLLYIGTLGKARFIMELVDVVGKLSDIKCVIGGRGKDAYVDTLRDKCMNYSNVDFIGKVPPEEVLERTKRANAVVCMTDPGDKNNRIALANKQFEAMVCGRPIICTKNTYPGAFTEKMNCGLTARFEKNDLKNAIKKLRENPSLQEELGKNALKAAIREYNWSNEEEKLVSVYEDIR